MTNPQLLRLAEHLHRLKLFKIHERLDVSCRRPAPKS